MSSVSTELYEDIHREAFSFGANWRDFLQSLNEERLQLARQSLVDLTGLTSLAGRTFLDLGCGSGLFSLSACLLGAERVVSVDVDEASVACAVYLRERFSIPESQWSITSGSALDEPFLRSLGQFDVVYSWGVLHHTGDMWRALSHVPQLVLADGLLVLAIYNTYTPFPSSHFWRRIKRFYARGGRLRRGCMQVGHVAALCVALLCRGRNPLRYMREYGSFGARGMSFWHDVVDWLGGYPYEFATVPEITSFFEARGFERIKLLATEQIGCNQYVFRRISPVG